jgi:hypothetical protein
VPLASNSDHWAAAPFGRGVRSAGIERTGASEPGRPRRHTTIHSDTTAAITRPARPGQIIRLRPGPNLDFGSGVAWQRTKRALIRHRSLRRGGVKRPLPPGRTLINPVAELKSIATGFPAWGAVGYMSVPQGRLRGLDSNLDCNGDGFWRTGVVKTATLSSPFEYEMDAIGHPWTSRSTSLHPKVHGSIPCAGTIFGGPIRAKYYIWHHTKHQPEGSGELTATGFGLASRMLSFS